MSAERPEAMDVPGAARQPRYMRIVRELEREIAQNRYKVGDRLPGEHELCQRFDVSRFTVRQALRYLRDAGLVAARQGVGTVVAAGRVDRPFVHAVESLEGLTQYAETTRFRVGEFRLVVAGAQLARLLRCSRGQAWLRAEGYRYSPGDPAPLCWTEVYVNAEFDRIREQGGSESGMIFAFIQEQYGEQIVEVEQRLHAVLVPEAIAEGLQVDPGSPALQVERTYRSARGKTLEVAISVHPADRFNYTMLLRREHAGG